MADRKSPLRDRPLRLPGQSVQEELDDLFDDKLLFYVLLGALTIGLAVVEWWRYVMQPPYSPILFTAVAVVATCYSGIRIVQLRKKARALKLGRDGERIVAQELNRLRGRGAIVFHDLRGGRFNIDHVVLARQGIYVIETKTRSRRQQAQVRFDGNVLTVDGYVPDRDPIAQVRRAAQWLAQRLQEQTNQIYLVKPVVVFPGWEVNPIEEQGQSGVWVLNPKDFPGMVWTQPESISQEMFMAAIPHIADMARDD